MGYKNIQVTLLCSLDLSIRTRLGSLVGQFCLFVCWFCFTNTNYYTKSKPRKIIYSKIKWLLNSITETCIKQASHTFIVLYTLLQFTPRVLKSPRYQSSLTPHSSLRHSSFNLCRKSVIQKTPKKSLTLARCIKSAQGHLDFLWK